jgi:protein-tyrosine phosphatase
MKWERTPMLRDLKIDGIYNIRDLGGYAAEAGGTTCWRVLIRSGNLDQVPLASQQQLLDYGVKTVIDLRDEWEAQQFPDVFAQSPNVTYLNLPLVGNHLAGSAAWKAETANYTLLHELYAIYLNQCQAQIGAIIAALAESRSATIFHCHAGKDRSGIITALVLGLVGVADAVIAQDYAASQFHITHLVEQWRDYAVQHGQDMQRFERDVAAEATTMLSMLHDIKQHYGSVRHYLESCGVTDQHISQLQSRFIEMPK